MGYNSSMDDPKNDKRITIPESFFQKLETEKLRTGYGASKLLRGRKDAPKGVNSTFINNLLKRKLETAKPSHMQYVEGLYAELPSTDPEANKKKFENYERRNEHENYVPVDVELIQKHMDRSGLTVTDILAMVTEQGSGLSFGNLAHIVQGTQGSAFKTDYDLIIDCLKGAPDYKPPTLKKVKTSRQKLRDGYIALSPSLMERLQFYRSKQLLPHGIFKDIPFAPENPKPRDIVVWFSGVNASIKKSDWEFIKYHCEKALKAMEAES